MKLFKRFRNVLGISLILLLIMNAGLPAEAIVKNDDSPMNAASADQEYVFVQFGDAPIASYDGSISGYEKTMPAKGQKVNLNSPAAKKYGKRLESQRENYKKWLAKQLPKVEVVAEYDVTYNGLGLKLNGASLKDISRGPGVVKAGVSGTYRKTMSESTALINAGPIWNGLGGQANAGAGMKVGVIDSGIDQTHPFLQPNVGMKAPEGFPKGDTRFTSAKVIVAKVFNQDPKLSAEAVDSHGTHVAGTVAGKAGTVPTLGGKAMSGVAPGAYLGNYNVFPGNVADAKSLFIAKAVEEAVEDGMDVLNLSLGGTPHKGADLLDMSVNAAVDAGVVVAISAGNEGPGNYTVGSPGTADKVITVAATTNSRTFAMRLKSAALPGGETIATTGTQGGEVKKQLKGEYVLWSEVAGGDKLACTPVAGKPLEGKIALLQRGSCTFAEKINNAAAAGAVGVIVYQNSNADPIPMATDGVKIPAIMISKEAGETLAGWDGDKTVTIAYPPVETGAVPNLISDFSSWGPTPNYTLKPDVAAPGVNIYSSVVGGGYELYQGTSMASPHVAGAAAVLLAYSKQEQLGWGPAEVKASLMGTAQNVEGSVIPDTDVVNPLKVGAGIIDLGRAMNTPAMAFPSSLSFGLVRPTGNQSYQMTVTLVNPTDQQLDYSFSGDDNLKLSKSGVSIAAKSKAEFKVDVVNRGTHSGGKNVSGDFISGYITVTSTGGDIRIPYMYVIDYNR
ncbi:S8 family serine peptidase [Neobacillus sp. YIM B06451]|uniref:S8 family serine peptidase n=1 Tax=Neobacillus sp. YIM B06451 TaxID=3070994 RepID=UPI002931D991|nr:S8 family serine peptidase [Neobacillus sp. YIM B06451]